MNLVLVFRGEQGPGPTLQFCRENEIPCELHILGTLEAARAIRDAQRCFDGRGSGTPLVVGYARGRPAWAAFNPTRAQLLQALQILKRREEEE